MLNNNLLLSIHTLKLSCGVILAPYAQHIVQNIGPASCHLLNAFSHVARPTFSQHTTPLACNRHAATLFRFIIHRAVLCYEKLIQTLVTPRESNDFSMALLAQHQENTFARISILHKEGTFFVSACPIKIRVGMQTCNLPWTTDAFSSLKKPSRHPTLYPAPTLLLAIHPISYLTGFSHQAYLRRYQLPVRIQSTKIPLFLLF